MPALQKKHKKSSVHNIKSVMNTRYGIPTARGYNAPCFEGMVHYFMGFALMHRDNGDRRDRLSIALAIQNETKHFQVVSSNFQVQYWLAA